MLHDSAPPVGFLPNNFVPSVGGSEAGSAKTIKWGCKSAEVDEEEVKK